MDGVTDSPFREIVDNYGHPDILFTEFVPADGIVKGAINILYGLIRHKTKTPIIAQLFGAHPENLYKAAVVAAELGFDGVDINMGCPDKKVIQRGGGAALIKTPKLAQQCIISVKKALQDWFSGLELSSLHLSDDLIAFINKNKTKVIKKILPLSVKTRLGFDSIITKPWITALIEAGPSMITLHGRTLKELYHGNAHWEEIGKAASLVKQEGITFLGNGDIKSYKEALEKIKLYKCDGVLIGRAALGNPWIFSDKIPNFTERVTVVKHHAKLFLKFRPNLQLVPMRKHLAWYCKGFDKAASVRNSLTKVTTMSDLNTILASISIT